MDVLSILFKHPTGLVQGRAHDWLHTIRPRFLATVTAGLASLSPAVAAPCPIVGDERVQIAAVGSRLELRLADGRIVRLVGLDPPLPTPTNPDLDEIARVRLVAQWTGRSATLHLLSTAPDRWGRLAALVFDAGASASTGGGLATMAVAEGLGRYLAEPAAHPCRETLVAAESNARLAKLGLWTDPYYAVVAVDDRAGFIERSATLILAEGLLTEVEPGPYRTLLRFAAPVRDPSAHVRAGSHGGHMLVATIGPRAMKTFEAQRLDVRSLIGKRLRFRGLLDLRFGPRIDLTTPDELEPASPAQDNHNPAVVPSSAP